MPLYRVQLVRHIPLVDMPRNPFSLGIDVLKPIPCRAIYREWEFTARSEKQVRRLFDEAQKARVSNVIGFTIASIERVKAARPSGVPCRE